MITKNITLLKWYNFFYEFRPYGAIAILYFTQITGSFALGLAVFSIASIAAAGIPTVASPFLLNINAFFFGK